MSLLEHRSRGTPVPETVLAPGRVSEPGRPLRAERIVAQVRAAGRAHAGAGRQVQGRAAPRQVLAAARARARFDPRVERWDGRAHEARAPKVACAPAPAAVRLSAFPPEAARLAGARRGAPPAVVRGEQAPAAPALPEAPLAARLEPARLGVPEVEGLRVRRAVPRIEVHPRAVAPLGPRPPVRHAALHRGEALRPGLRDAARRAARRLAPGGWRSCREARLRGSRRFRTRPSPAGAVRRREGSWLACAGPSLMRMGRRQSPRPVTVPHENRSELNLAAPGILASIQKARVAGGELGLPNGRHHDNRDAAGQRGGRRLPHPRVSASGDSPRVSTNSPVILWAAGPGAHVHG